MIKKILATLAYCISICSGNSVPLYSVPLLKPEEFPVPPWAGEEDVPFGDSILNYYDITFQSINYELLNNAKIGDYIYIDERLYDKSGYRVAVMQINKTNSTLKMLHYSQLSRHSIHYQKDRRLEEAQIIQKHNAYYVLFPTLDKDKNISHYNFLAEIITDGFQIEFTQMGTQYLFKNDVYSHDPQFPDYPVLSPKETEKIALQIIRILKGEEKPQYATEEEAKRRDAAWFAMLDDLQKHTPNYAQNKWEKALVAQSVYIEPVGHYSQCNEALKRLKTPEFKEFNTIPNICEGTDGFCNTGDYLPPSLLKRYNKKTKRNFKAIHQLGGPTAFAYQLSDGQSDIYIYILHMYNPTMAMREMLLGTLYREPIISLYNIKYVRFMYERGGDDRRMKADEILDRIRWNPGRVGDYDVAMRPLMTPEGEILKGSERRAAFFMRGNTVVSVFTADPTLNVLPLAQELDKKIARFLQSKKIPLVREQKYLKSAP